MTTDGRYYWSADDNPFLGGPHNYGSKTWYEDNWEKIQWLGEDLETRTKWNDGVPPEGLPKSIQIGNTSCIENGELYANRIPDGLAVNGFNALCFPPAFPVDPIWAIVSDYSSCSMQYFYATILAWSYVLDIGSITTAFNMLLGPIGQITMHVGNDLYPTVVTVVLPTCTVAICNGTSNYQQAATQPFEALVGPTNFGVVGTLPLWYSSATRLNSLLNLVLADPNKPIMFVGHSYGAATAVILAGRYRAWDAERKITRLTFGSPKPGNLALATLMDTVNGIDIANDNDWVTTLPPNALELTPVSIALGVAILFIWDTWYRPRAQYMMDGGGVLQPNSSPIIGYITLLNFAVSVLASLDLPIIVPHRIEEYRRRILNRCPGPEWPVEPPLWVILVTAQFPSLANLLLGAREPGLNGGLMLGIGNIGELDGIVLCAIDVAAGQVMLGDPTSVATGQVELGDPTAVAAGQIVLGDPTAVATGQVELGDPTAVAAGQIVLGDPTAVATGQVELGDPTDVGPGEIELSP